MKQKYKNIDNILHKILTKIHIIIKDQILKISDLIIKDDLLKIIILNRQILKILND